MKFLFIAYVIASLLFVVYSYGFVDKNLILSTNDYYQSIHKPLHHFVFENRVWAGATYIAFLVVFWLLYYVILKNVSQKKVSILQMKNLILCVSVIFLLSFPAFSYDIFNYMLTARVTYTHRENPWVVRPVEIPNEPALAYTRAANKWALYGPTWILLTYVPHVIGIGNVWLTIITFKLLIVGFYLAFTWLIWRITKNLWNTAFFAFNPLVLVTTLNEGHNDIVMMFFALLSVYLIKSRFLSILTWLASLLVKGATLILIPLYFLKNKSSEQRWLLAYWFMFVVFLLSPFREEMYPWYFTWCLCFLVLLPRRYRFVYGLSVAICIGLLLRNTAYIVTREYDSLNQVFRSSSTVLSIVVYLSCYLFHRYAMKKNE